MNWLSKLKVGPGNLIGTSSWMLVDQSRIDRFANATGDFQFIHVDPKRAAHETPFGGTIAHGMLTLSLVSPLAAELLPPTNALKALFVAGIDRVKFVTPLRVNRRVRGIFTLDRTLEMAQDRALLRIGVTIEIEGETKPALTCELSLIAMTGESDAASSRAPAFETSIGRPA